MTARRAMNRGIGLLVATVLLGVPARSSSQQPVIPPPTGLVNDFAHVLDAGSIERITRIAADVREKSRGEITIVTLPDLAGRDVADVALDIGRTWKVGKIGNPGDPTRNAGAVILLVPKETNSDNSGRCFVLTGQGTEGFITDATAGEICREATPSFRNRDYASGLELVTLRTAQRFASEFNFTLDTTLVPPPPPVTQRQSGGRFPPQLYFIIIVVIWMIIQGMMRGRGNRGGCGGGGGGGLGSALPWIILNSLGNSGGRGGSGWGGGGGGGFGGGGGGFGGFGGGGGFSGGGGGSSW